MLQVFQTCFPFSALQLSANFFFSHFLTYLLFHMGEHFNENVSPAWRIQWLINFAILSGFCWFSFSFFCFSLIELSFSVHCILQSFISFLFLSIILTLFFGFWTCPLFLFYVNCPVCYWYFSTGLSLALWLCNSAILKLTARNEQFYLVWILINFIKISLFFFFSKFACQLLLRTDLIF